MAISAVRNALAADAGVTALVPATRITPIIRPQSVMVPAITLQRIASTPQNHLRGWASLDANLVQIDIWTDRYTTSRGIAAACRTALQAATFVMDSEADNYEPEVDPELYRLTQTWQVWTN